MSERGQRHEEKVSTEDNACVYFLKRIFQAQSKSLSKFLSKFQRVEVKGLEPSTYGLQSRRSSS
jgi:hypothetical protein